VTDCLFFELYDPMESIRIQSFAGLQDATIELKPINVFVGPQAAGKSVAAKLIYFFQGIPHDLIKCAREQKTLQQAQSVMLQKFEEFFPKESWDDSNFEIEYTKSDYRIQVLLHRKKTTMKIQLSDFHKDLFKQLRQFLSIEANDIYFNENKTLFTQTTIGNQSIINLPYSILKNVIFIPAGRSFFANLQSSIFTILASRTVLDPFLIEFGAYYESIKFRYQKNDQEDQLDSLIFDIIGSEYHRIKDKDILLHASQGGQRKVNVANASSGQQETLPLILIIKDLIEKNSQHFTPRSLFIEEPETHLFPAAQNKIVQLLALLFNRHQKSTSLVITTHSPYVLTSLNNLVQASLTHQQVSEEKKSAVEAIIPKELFIEPGALGAFAFADGEVRDIMDQETGLINGEYLDSVSEVLNQQFHELLNLED
jgi:predicted ATP-dependent endonuclease of OLD family